MFVRVIALLCLIALVVGCTDNSHPTPFNSNSKNGPPTNRQAGEKPDIPIAPTTFTYTITATTEFYKIGPQQAQPPDGEFKVGTKVKIIEEAGSYSLVQSEDGIEAYVASDVLKKSNDHARPRMSPDVPAVVRGNNGFALDLYSKLRVEESGNLFFSPISISTAFAMTFAGAKGETASQMADVLRFDLPQDRLHAAFASVEAALHRDGQALDYRMNVANRLWGQQGLGFLPEFLQITRESYKAELAQVDFIKESESARQTINRWVEEQTANKIKNLIPPGALDSDSRLVLTNAIYFKADWTHKFYEFETEDAPFQITHDEKVDVPMMTQTANFAYGVTENMQCLEMPYGKDKHLSMLVLLPRKTDGLGHLEDNLTSHNLEKWTSKLFSQEVRVYLPKFKLESQFHLNSVLQSMGMTLAFTRGVADFTGISQQEPLYISAAIHKSFVAIDEKGTEAAAATGIAMKTASIEPEPVVFRADHPFLFLIRDNRTKSILFLGRVINPKE